MPAWRKKSRIDLIWGLSGAIALLLLLTACSGLGGRPDVQLVSRAIDLQLSQTQKELTPNLHLDRMPTWKIDGLSITGEDLLKIQNLPTFRLRGTYDLTLALPTQQVTRRKNPFDIYLQRQKEGKTWRLLRPQNRDGDREPIWNTYLIKPSGYD